MTVWIRSGLSLTLKLKLKSDILSNRNNTFFARDSKPEPPAQHTDLNELATNV